MCLLSLVGCHCSSAFQPQIHAHALQTRQSTQSCYSNCGFESCLSRKIVAARSTTTSSMLTIDTTPDFSSSSWIQDSYILISFDFGELIPGIFGFGLVFLVGAFVYANVVYTPEILEGSKSLMLSEREKEIRKLLGAVESHKLEGKDVVELRLPLETALGKPLERYIQEVLDFEANDDDFIYTAADTELATMLKQIF